MDLQWIPSSASIFFPSSHHLPRLLSTQPSYRARVDLKHANVRARCLLAPLIRPVGTHACSRRASLFDGMFLYATLTWGSSDEKIGGNDNGPQCMKQTKYPAKQEPADKSLSNMTRTIMQPTHSRALTAPSSLGQSPGCNGEH